MGSSVTKFGHKLSGSTIDDYGLPMIDPFTDFLSVIVEMRTWSINLY